MKILFVEDDESTLSIIAEMIEYLGYSVDAVSNGYDALARLPGHTILITDWMMPEMTGIELIKEARKAHPDLYIIMATGKSTPDNVLEGLIAGANDYMVKPIDASDLQLRLHLAEASIGLQRVAQDIRNK